MELLRFLGSTPVPVWGNRWERERRSTSTGYLYSSNVVKLLWLTLCRKGTCSFSYLKRSVKARDE